MPDDAAVFEISHRLADLFPESFILETEDCDFDPFGYADAGKCALHSIETTHAQLQTTWDAGKQKIDVAARNAFFEVLWRGKRLHCLCVTYGNCDTKRYYLMADGPEEARAFFSAVCGWTAEVHDEIMVFRGGYWYRDKALMSQIERASFDTLVLPGRLREELLEDFEGFFAAKETYREIGVAWKRGILLLGPPGNGKTHCIKALVKRLGKPCLYVRSFKPSRGTVCQSIESVFQKAREVAPCMLVLEDLDSLIDDANRSYFLNAMDGFADNEGILTVATTNHPKKLDPALLERPSRFDRKITFALPAEEERRRFLAQDDAKRQVVARMSDEEIDEIAKLTGGFSFAYLKELGLSALMAWARNPQPGRFVQAMRGQVDTLRRQMRTEKPAPKADEDED